MEDVNLVEPAILVRGISKQYGDEKKVLDNLDMTVIKGVTYVLLGSSGCGKTTLLDVILGTRKIRNGCISILGRPPRVVPLKSIGYLPQDVVLDDDLTIKKLLQHQGRISGMTGKKIEERYNFYKNLLDLPLESKLIRILSGGQRRRVLLAVVLINDPELLILDEPTMGLDPALRQNLWDYFIKITKEEKRTVVITTQFTEDARKADMVGILQNGKMLIEGENQKLLDQFNYNSLDDLYTSLCLKQETDSNMNMSCQKKVLISESDELKILSQKTPKKSPMQEIDFTNIRHAKALLSKNFNRNVRHPGLIIIVLVLPMIEIFTIFTAVGGILDDFKIGIVNEELGNYTNCKDYINNNKTASGYLIDNTTCMHQALGCRFVQQLENVFKYQVYFKSVNEALEAIKERKIHQILYFPHNYSNTFAMINNSFNDILPEETNFSKITFYREEAGNPLGFYVEKELYYTYLKFLKNLSKVCKWEKSTEELLIHGKLDLTYCGSIAFGVVIILVMTTAKALAILTIVSERNGGIWQRTITNGKKSAPISISHMITVGFTSAISTAECFLLEYFVFGHALKGNVVNSLLIFYSQALVGVVIATGKR